MLTRLLVVMLLLPALLLSSDIVGFFFVVSRIRNILLTCQIRRLRSHVGMVREKLCPKTGHEFTKFVDDGDIPCSVVLNRTGIRGSAEDDEIMGRGEKSSTSVLRIRRLSTENAVDILIGTYCAVGCGDGRQRRGGCENTAGAPVALPTGRIYPYTHRRILSPRKNIKI